MLIFQTFRTTIEIIRITYTFVSFRYLFSLILFTKTLGSAILTITSSSFGFWRLLSAMYASHPYSMSSRYSFIYSKKSSFKSFHSSKVSFIEFTSLLESAKNRFRNNINHFNIQFFTTIIAIGCRLFCNFTAI